MPRLAAAVPDDVLMGIHLCYGTFPEWPMYEAGPRYLRSQDDDFGVAMYCGFGRQPGEDGDATMRDHRETVLGR